MSDASILDMLAAVTSRALNRLARDDARRDHLNASSVSGGLGEGKCWGNWPKAVFEVAFVPLPPLVLGDGIQLDGRRFEIRDGTIRLNSQHSDFRTRLPGGRVGHRAIGYVAMLCAGAYTTFRYGQDMDAERLVQVASRLESAISVGMDRIRTKEVIR